MDFMKGPIINVRIKVSLETVSAEMPAFNINAPDLLYQLFINLNIPTDIVSKNKRSHFNLYNASPARVLTLISELIVSYFY